MEDARGVTKVIELAMPTCNQYLLELLQCGRIIIPIATFFLHCGQFIGFSGSSGPSQYTALGSFWPGLRSHASCFSSSGDGANVPVGLASPDAHSLPSSTSCKV